MNYFNKHIISFALISCVFFAKTSMVITEPITNALEKNKLVILSKTDSKKTGPTTSIKISPMRTNHKFIDELSKNSFAEKKTKQENTKFLPHKTPSAGKVSVIHNNELKFIDGYKIDLDGKHSTYFYGYISGYKNGNLYGYLYDKMGQPVYFYGRSTHDDRKSIYVHDQQSGIYILNN